MIRVLLTTLIVVVLSACRLGGSDQNQREEIRSDPYEYVEMVMASPVIIRVYASSESMARRAVRDAFDRMHALEMTLSDWMQESESNRLEAASPEAIEISDDLRHALTISRTLWDKTDGMFDPTIGPLVDLWRKTRISGRMPQDEEILLARSRVDLDSIELLAKTARIRRRDVELDFGAIGKGIALDAASLVLDEYGMNRHLINFDGEILTGDTPPGKESWQITILPTGTEETLIIDAEQVSIATSGGVNQFLEIDGKRYSHIIDPSTGVGTSCARQVTVVCDSATHADVLATVGCIIDEARFEEILRTHFQDASAVIMENDGRTTNITRIGDPPVRFLDAP